MNKIFNNRTIKSYLLPVFSNQSDSKYRVYQTLFGLGLILGLGAGCHGSGNTYAPAWYDVYGNYCGGSPGPGCNFYYDGSKIVDTEDPFFYSSYQPTNNTWFYTDSYGNPMYYTGTAWLSPSGVLYDYYGYALNSDQESAGYDLIAQIEDQERTVYEAVGRDFAQKYALNEDVGIDVARKLNDYATFVRKQERARTTQDVEAFSKSLLGISPDKALAALEDAKKGELDAMTSIHIEVANQWKTSPETAKTILKSWYRKHVQMSSRE